MGEQSIRVAGSGRARSFGTMRKTARQRSGTWLALMLVVASGCSKKSEATNDDGKAAKIDLTGKGLGEVEALCDSKNGDACFEAAMRHKAGKGTEKNVDKAVELVRRSCDLESARGCLELGVVVATVVDTAASVPIFEKACRLGEAKGCRGAAMAYTGGVASLSADPTKAMALYERGCDLDDAESCVRAAALIETGKAVSDASSMTLLRKACALGHEKGCDLSKTFDDAQEASDRIDKTLAESKALVAKINAERAKSLKREGIEWVIDGSIVDEFQIKKVECEAPSGGHRWCSLVYAAERSLYRGKKGALVVKWSALSPDNVQDGSGVIVNMEYPGDGISIRTSPRLAFGAETTKVVLKE